MLRRTIVGRARERSSRLAWLRQAEERDAASAPDRFAADGRPLTDGITNAYQPKVAADHPDYAEKVAKPVMDAVDSMPKAYRDACHEYGYADVFRAWRRGITPARIRQMAEANGGRFVL